MRRIGIVGTTGSGKNWLGTRIAKKLKLTFIDLDDLHWDPNWQSVNDEEFRRRIRAAIAKTAKISQKSAVKPGQGAKTRNEGGWVIAGNYSRMDPETHHLADTIIWLDYPIWRTFWQLLVRQLYRLMSQETHCNGNTESWRLTFSKNSLFIWFAKTAPKASQKFSKLYTDPAYTGKTIVRLRSPKETQRYLASL